MKHAMDDQDRLAGLKALLESHKTNSYDLIDPDGEFRLWRDLSAEGKLEAISRDALYFDVAFEQFAEVARESVGSAAIEEAAMRLAMRSSRELHDLESLFPDDGRIESPPPLVERVRELLSAQSPEHEDETWLSAEEQSVVFKEMRADEAAAKREDAHSYGNLSLHDLRGEKTNSSAAEMGKEKDMER